MQESGNIVIIDDNPNNLQVLSGILQEAGFKVRPALSGVIGLRGIQAHLPDLVLLDIRMPGMDGYETCNILKNNDETRDIPVIFISALNAIEDKLAAFQAGGVDYLTKPFQPEEVIARVRAHVELARARKSLAESNVRLKTLMEQLVLAEKLKSLGALAAGISHELNTPIGNVLLAAGTIEEAIRVYPAASKDNPNSPATESLLDTCRSCTKLMLRNLERASTLIGAMKEMVVDRASERKRRINLHETVADFMMAASILLRNTPYRIDNAISPDLFIETYPGPLEQILENLIQNAIVHGFDHAAQGTILIATTAPDDEGVTLIVSDNGKGIPAENLSRIFDPFFTTRLGQGGSGLGLHIVYNLVNGVLGGHITASSTPGVGAEFRLKLPWVAPADNLPLTGETLATRDPARFTPLGSEKHAE